MDSGLLQSLLAQGEGASLDYKSEQYRFIGATENEKAELLKDILAMANAWRQADGYILIGVEERPGRKAVVVGIHGHLDDASLQEFVNKKTNRPIHFSYSEYEADGKTIAFLHIPLQEQRPVFLKRRFGPLEANTVYLRRGSSTDVADPDEIYSMGASSLSAPKPSLRVECADIRTRNALGQILSLKREILRPVAEDELPEAPRAPGGFLAQLDSVDGRPNPDYWRELAEYLCLRSILGSVGFVVTNRSAVIASGVCVRLTTPFVDRLFLREEQPERPQSRTYSFGPLSNPTVNRDVECARHGDLWHIDVTFGKVQPGATVWSEDELLIGTLDERQVVLSGHIFGDNFQPEPLEVRIDSRPALRDMTIAELRAEDEYEEQEPD